MTNVIKAKSGNDFLALLPTMLGYTPTDSIVFVAFNGNRTIGGIRFDLEATNRPNWVTDMLKIVTRVDNLTHIVPVIYTNDDYVDGYAPHLQVAADLTAYSDMVGPPLRDFLMVTPTRWMSFVDKDTPADGHPLAEIGESAVSELVEAPTATYLGETKLPDVDATIRDEIAALVDQPSTDLGNLDSIFTLFEDAITADALTATERARLLLIFDSPTMRDVALIQWARGRDDESDKIARHALLNVANHTVIHDTLGATLAGMGDRPDVDRLKNALDVALLLAASAPTQKRAAPLVMAGWCAWALGQSSRAAVFADQSIAIDPDYTFPALLKTMTDSGFIPDWAFQIPQVDEADLIHLNPDA
ncbi:DUF4192 family protein [Leifsonia sp. Leaf264]|uniref:DUF4192 family protein n=1 Tax=Leifsonia sp. Leaf264 TaxID=1736314 RepID=UPI000B2A8A3D|nr:DUF4192 family protein [Leifsonia sp. Leaf264]